MNSKQKKSPERKRPLYQRASAGLTDMLDGLEPGTYLPSEPELASQLGVSRATLREAMRSFEHRGLIIRRQGVGTYVSDKADVIETGLEVLQSIETLAARKGLDVEIGDLKVTRKPTTEEEAKLFDQGGSTELAEVERVILTSGKPAAFLIDHFPADLLPAEILGEEFRGSVLDLFLEMDAIQPAHSLTDIRALAAVPPVSNRLEVEEGEVLLCLEACLYDYSNQLIDVSISYFLPEFFRFHIVRRVEMPY